MSLIIEGKCAYFGGPDDHGVAAAEGLALVGVGDVAKFAGCFLPAQPHGTTGLARRLDPNAHYIACRWNYAQTSRSYLQEIRVDVCDPHNPSVHFPARPVDWGPAAGTRRVACLSPGLMKALGVDTDHVVRVVVPLPGDATPTPSVVEAARAISAPASPVAPTTTLTRQIWPLQRDCPAFYGNPATTGWRETNTVLVPVPWQMRMGGTPVGRIRIHKKCAASLARVLNFVWEQAGKSQSKIAELRYDRFSGSYNFRPMRGGASLSMHSYAAAIDWDDADNQQRSQHHLFTNDSLLIKAFKAEGWEWGGDWDVGSIDAMHVQAARVHGG
jgi:hypothetical protein